VYCTCVQCICVHISASPQTARRKHAGSLIRALAGYRWPETRQPGFSLWIPATRPVPPQPHAGKLTCIERVVAASSPLASAARTRSRAAITLGSSGSYPSSRIAERSISSIPAKIPDAAWRIDCAGWGWITSILIVAGPPSPPSSRCLFKRRCGGVGATADCRLPNFVGAAAVR